MITFKKTVLTQKGIIIIQVINIGIQHYRSIFQVEKVRENDKIMAVLQMCGFVTDTHTQCLEKVFAPTCYIINCDEPHFQKPEFTFTIHTPARPAELRHYLNRTCLTKKSRLNERTSSHNLKKKMTSIRLERISMALRLQRTTTSAIIQMEKTWNSGILFLEWPAYQNYCKSTLNNL